MARDKPMTLPPTQAPRDLNKLLKDLRAEALKKRATEQTASIYPNDPTRVLPGVAGVVGGSTRTSLSGGRG